MFERPSLRQLVERTRADIITRLTPEEMLRRSDAEVYARVLAGASHELHGHLQWIVQQVIYDTAEGEFLKRWASLWGMSQKPAQFASGTVNATGSGAVLVGTLYRRADGAEFEVTNSTSVPGAVPVRALVAGATGNTEGGASLSLMTPVAGVSTVATVVSIANGSDIETIESLRARFLSRIRKPPNGGSDSDYVTWALEVPGVTRAWVFPRELGAGTVTVRFVRDGDASPIPDTAEVAVVRAYLEQVRPVTADVYVFAPVPVPLNFTISLSPPSPEVKAAVAASLADLLRRESAPGATILVSHIREAISISAGEADHTLAAPAANVTHTTGQMATMGTITWT